MPDEEKFLSENRLILCRQDKKPISNSWQTIRPTYGEIKEHLSHPGNLLGIRPGSLDCVVVDVDKAPDFDKAASDIASGIKGYPLHIVKTPSGGRHLWFAFLRENGQRFGNKKWAFGGADGDIRCDNGYIILWDLPGTAQRLVAGPPLRLPGARLAAWLEQANPKPPRQPSTATSDHRGRNGLLPPVSELDWQPGNRNNSLNEGVMRRAAWGQPYEDMIEEARSAGLQDAEINRTVASAREAGEKELAQHPERLHKGNGQQGNRQEQREPGDRQQVPAMPDPKKQTSELPPRVDYLKYDTKDLQKPDMLGILYSDKTNWIYGSPGCCKTWIALQAAVDLVKDGRRVLFLDSEDDPATFKSRLGILESPQWLRDNFFELVYLDAFDWKEVIEQGRENWRKWVGSDGHIFIDAAGSSGAGESGESFEEWRKLFLLHPHTTVVDHIPKNQDPGGEGPIGSVQKFAKVSGSAIFVDKKDPWTPGTAGFVEAVNQKDRPGGLGKRESRTRIDGRIDNSERLTITVGEQKAKPGPADDTKKRERVLALIRKQPGIGRNGINTAIGGNKNDIKPILDRLLESGEIELRPGDRKGSHAYYPTAPQGGLSLPEQNPKPNRD